MELLNFLNTHPNNWQELLAAEPYNLEIKSDEIDGIVYYIVKYHQFLSDFSYQLVKEARGSIFRYDNTEEWVCVCHPFDKFFNYGEKFSAVHEIDWETASVQQKVDGSLVKFWWDNNKWHISTNGTIDANKAICGETTYGNLVKKTIGKIPHFYSRLNKNYCYMFELTSPFNHIVVKYENVKLWYLGRRDISNHMEDNEPLNCKGLMHPEIYPHYSLAECVAAAHEMGEDEEGYVVCDANFNRIKIKGDEYLRLHKIRGNGALTVLRVVEMWQNDSLDDFVAYYPEFEEFVKEVLQRINYYRELCDTAFSTIMSVSGHAKTRYDFARVANTYIPLVRVFAFARLDGKVKDGNDYLMNMRARTLASYIMAEMDTTKIGVEEDE